MFNCYDISVQITFGVIICEIVINNKKVVILNVASSITWIFQTLMRKNG